MTSIGNVNAFFSCLPKPKLTCLPKLTCFSEPQQHSVAFGKKGNVLNHLSPQNFVEENLKQAANNSIGGSTPTPTPTVLSQTSKKQQSHATQGVSSSKRLELKKLLQQFSKKLEACETSNQASLRAQFKAVRALVLSIGNTYKSLEDSEDTISNQDRIHMADENINNIDEALKGFNSIDSEISENLKTAVNSAKFVLLQFKKHAIDSEKLSIKYVTKQPAVNILRETAKLSIELLKVFILLKLQKNSTLAQEDLEHQKSEIEPKLLKVKKDAGLVKSLPSHLGVKYTEDKIQKLREKQAGHNVGQGTYKK